MRFIDPKRQRGGISSVFLTSKKPRWRFGLVLNQHAVSVTSKELSSLPGLNPMKPAGKGACVS